MPKGYWIASINVRDQGAYDTYRSRNGGPLGAHGGRFLVRGGQTTKAFGEARQHNVVVEFPSYEAALACYNSAEYQAVARFLQEGSDVNLVIVAGYEGPQPQ